MTAVALPFERAEYDARIAKARRAMTERGIDLLVVTDPSNMAWLTGYDGWSFYVHQCVLLGMEGEPVWYGRDQDANGARRTVFMGDDHIIGYPDHYVQSSERHPMDYLAGLIKSRGQEQARIGVEMDNHARRFAGARRHGAIAGGGGAGSEHRAPGLNHLGARNQSRALALIDPPMVGADERLHERAGPIPVRAAGRVPELVGPENRLLVRREPHHGQTWPRHARAADDADAEAAAPIYLADDLDRSADAINPTEVRLVVDGERDLVAREGPELAESGEADLTGHVGRAIRPLDKLGHLDEDPVDAAPVQLCRQCRVLPDAEQMLHHGRLRRRWLGSVVFACSHGAEHGNCDQSSAASHFILLSCIASCQYSWLIIRNSGPL
jgi:hypothetical protein